VERRDYGCGRRGNICALVATLARPPRQPGMNIAPHWFPPARLPDCLPSRLGVIVGIVSPPSFYRCIGAIGELVFADTEWTDAEMDAVDAALAAGGATTVTIGEVVIHVRRRYGAADCCNGVLLTLKFGSI